MDGLYAGAPIARTAMTPPMSKVCFIEFLLPLFDRPSFMPRSAGALARVADRGTVRPPAQAQTLARLVRARVAHVASVAAQKRVPVPEVLVEGVDPCVVSVDIVR